MTATIELGTGDVRAPRAAWRPFALAVMGAAVLVTTGVGVFATLSASANNITPQAVDSGTLELSLADNGAGFSQLVSKIAPGDVDNRYVTLTNSGSLAGQALTLSTTATGTANLIADGSSPSTTKGLRIGVTSCSVAWSAAAGTCAGTTTSVLSPTALSSMTTPQTIIAGSIAVSQSVYLRISVSLPEQSETTVNGVLPANTVQGGSVDITYTFVEAQRAANTTNS